MKFFSLSTMATPVISIYLYENCVFIPQSTYICRVQSCVWRLPKYWPPPPSPPSEYVLPFTKGGGGVHTRQGVRGWGVNILEDARIGFLQYNLSTVCPFNTVLCCRFKCSVFSVEFLYIFARDKWRQLGSLGYKRWLIREPSSIPFLKTGILCVSTLELCTCTHVRFNLFYSSLIYKDLVDTSGD